ncbi:MAG: undecaprenyl-diphosphate phosphatase [Victivallales bacterium]|nr:undecaprenyl-diphosphate phosphatase [Victivallales bacterium]
MSLIFKTILLGIIQGLTEFLPISSTGHMIIVEEYLPLPTEEFKKAFFVIVQLGSILAVLVYFWKKLFPAAAFKEKVHFNAFCRLWLKVAVGVLPVMILGYLFGKTIQEHLYGIWTVAIALLLGGVILLVLEGRKLPLHHNDLESFPFAKAIGVGLFQCIALIPGVSRSASTIIGGLLLGASRTLAVEYSFFLSIPTMFAASAYSLLKSGAHLTRNEWTATAVGFVTAFLVSWAVIAFLMSYIRKKDFRIFGWYRIFLALLLIAWKLLR